MPVTTRRSSTATRNPRLRLNEKEIMILIKEKKRRESSKYRITKVPLWVIYTHNIINLHDN